MEYIQNNITLVIIFCLILFLLITWYFTSYSIRTSSKIRQFEKEFLKYNKRSSYDFCNKNKQLSEYYVCSSYMPYLTGFQKYDYSSLNMFTQVIKYGARFVYLQCYQDHMKNPVFSSGNELGTIIESQNYIHALPLFKFIGKYVFDEAFIDNSNDPFIIFLDLRVNKNKEVLDKLYEIIKSTCNHHLYGKFHSNIAQTNMCKLMNKMLIFTTNNYGKSKLKEIIHMDTSSSYLKLYRVDELPTKEILTNPNDLPLISLNSTKIQFSNNLIQIEDNTNFINLGLNKTYVLKIKGSKYNESGDRLYEIDQVTMNSIRLSGDFEFKQEYSGENVQLQFFNKSYMLLNLPKENKNALTIVTPDNSYFKGNFNPYDGYNLGCQFICMNFQEQDQNLRTYMKKFKKFSFKVKPEHLINYNPPEKVPNINSLVLPVNDLDIPILFQFRFNYDTIRLQPSTIDNLRIIAYDNIPVVSPNYNLTNSFFKVTEGLDGKSGSISLKLGNKYLSSNDGCCWLSFQEFPERREQASFYPIKSLNSQKDTISLAQIKKDKKYYLRHRLGFNYKTQLYSKTTNSYKLITYFNNNEDTIMGVFEPLSQNGFKCYGQILVPSGTNPNTIHTPIVKGACAFPVDFKLIYTSNNSQYIWKMIPQEGYIALGNIVTRSNVKPRKSNYYTIAFEYLNQVDLGEKAWNTPNDVNIKPMSLWFSNDKSYFISYNSNANNKRPSQFAFPIYTINTTPKTYNERLFMDSVESNEVDTASFILHSEPGFQPNNVPVKYSSVKNNKSDFRILNINNSKCLSIDDSLWSNFNPNYNNSENVEPEKLLMKTNNENDFSNMWIYYKKDNTFRLKGNPKYALCVKNDELYIDKVNVDNIEDQKFQYTFDNKLVHNKSLKCVVEKDNKLMLEPCNGDSKWMISQTPVYQCINVNNSVYVKRRVKRGISNYFNDKGDLIDTYNVLKQFSDPDYIYVYVLGQVKELKNNGYIIELKGNLGFIETESDDVVLYKNASKNELRIGSMVLCRNGGLLVDGYEESNVRWEANIVEILEDDKVVVLFNINTMELNMNRDALGRPRKNEPKTVSIHDLILIKPYISCA